MPGDESPRFIIGTGRCGSTILSKMLDVHPEVCVLSEFLVGLDGIKKYPDKWIHYFNSEIERRLGNEDLQLPWSVKLHGERNIDFKTFKSLHRFYTMLAHLHAIHRRAAMAKTRAS